MKRIRPMKKLNDYLKSTEVIDWQIESVRERATELAAPCSDPSKIAKSCFEWVRDDISHSGDVKSDVTTVSASEVLKEGTGWCFAKSHLLAALLRANNIPAGLCYQRLTRGDGHTLHGLNAVYLEEHGWYRIDPRGNKQGVDAQFTPPVERLAWPTSLDGEVDFPAIHEEPLEIVIDCLGQNDGWAAVRENLPDLQ